MRERSRPNYLEVFFFGALGFEAFLGKSLAKVAFILAALFLWINLFLTALSAKEIADLIFSAVLLFLAVRIAFSKLTKISLLTVSFFLELLKALFAVFVTGIL